VPAIVRRVKERLRSVLGEGPEIVVRPLRQEALEAIRITAREVLLVSRRKPNGFFGFSNAFVEQRVGVSATSRNWSTVIKLVEDGRTR
jgi:hypothetical protein